MREWRSPALLAQDVQEINEQLDMSLSAEDRERLSTRKRLLLSDLVNACAEPPLTGTAGAIVAECDQLKRMLLAKNHAYGDSAIRPVRVFSKASAVEQILVRIDDKLSRLSRGEAAGEDVIQDLLGYLILLRIARKRASAAGEVDGTAATDL